MKGYIAKKSFVVGGQGEGGTIFEGTIYIPEVGVQIRKRVLNLEPIDYFFDGVLHKDKNSFEEIELEDKKINNILSMKSRRDQAEKDLGTAVRKMYQSIS